MTERTQGSLMMLGATLAWGSSYLFMQQGLRSLEPFNLTALRFGVGFAAAIPVLLFRLNRITPRGILDSALLGFLLNLCFYAVMKGLQSTTTGNAGFLLGATVIFVQLETALIRKKCPSAVMTGAAVLAFGGIMLLTLHDHFRIGTGDLFCLLSAFGYSWHIMLTGKLSRKSDPLTLGVMQLGWVTVFALTGMRFIETPHLPGSPAAWTAVLVLGVICSAGGFLLQTAAQSRLDTARTGIVFAMEPVFAFILGAVLLNEPLTLRSVSGAALILAAVIATHWTPAEKKKDAES